MGCRYHETTETIAWPDGVDRMLVYCIGGGGAGDADGIGDVGGGGGGGGGFAESLVLKTEANYTVTIGTAGDTPGEDGTDSYFQQGATTNVLGTGGQGANGAAGGLGGTGGTGSVTYDGGDGGDGAPLNRGGGGGGYCGTGGGAGNPGNDGSGDTGGQGGADLDTGTHFAGDGGDDGMNGTSAPAGSKGLGGGGPGAGGTPGNGSPGVVVCCWEDPEPIGYCVNTGERQRWWPGCNLYCGGMQCFYYGYYDGPYFYEQGWAIPCCSNVVYPARLTLTVTNETTGDTQSVPLVATSVIANGAPTYRAALDTPINGYNYLWLLLYDNGCYLGQSDTADAVDTPYPIGTVIVAYECSPLFLSNEFYVGDDTYTVIITE